MKNYKVKLEQSSIFRNNEVKTSLKQHFNSNISHLELSALSRGREYIESEQTIREKFVTIEINEIRQLGHYYYCQDLGEFLDYRFCLTDIKWSVFMSLWSGL